MERLESRLKEQTSRSNGWEYAKRKYKQKEYIRGWGVYYHLANMKRLLLGNDSLIQPILAMKMWQNFFWTYVCDYFYALACC